MPDTFGDPACYAVGIEKGDESGSHETARHVIRSQHVAVHDAKRSHLDHGLSKEQADLVLNLRGLISKRLELPAMIYRLETF